LEVERTLHKDWAVHNGITPTDIRKFLEFYEEMAVIAPDRANDVPLTSTPATTSLFD